MFTRLCKAFRLWRQKGEFALSKQEESVMCGIIRVLIRYPGYQNINTQLWDQIIRDMYPFVCEEDLSTV